MTTCPYCNKEWVRATSSTTGCCDAERTVRGYIADDEEALIDVFYDPASSYEERRNILSDGIVEHVNGPVFPEIDWRNPPEGKTFMHLECLRCNKRHVFRRLQDVPMEGVTCACGRKILAWKPIVRRL